MALTAVPAPPALPVFVVPSFSVTVPPATSTTEPFDPVTTSDWTVLLPVKAAVPAASTRLTATLTVPTVTASDSVTNVAPAVLLVLSVPTVVSRWLPLAPMAAPAVTSRLAAVTSTTLLSVPRSSTLPEASSATLPVPAAISPTVTSPPSACTRTLPQLPAPLVITAPSTIDTPASACTSTVPPAVVMSAVASFRLTPSLEITLM